MNWKENLLSDMTKSKRCINLWIKENDSFIESERDSFGNKLDDVYVEMHKKSRRIKWLIVKENKKLRIKIRKSDNIAEVIEMLGNTIKKINEIEIENTDNEKIYQECVYARDSCLKDFSVMLEVLKLNE